jgi:hypothetical protein
MWPMTTANVAGAPALRRIRQAERERIAEHNAPCWSRSPSRSTWRRSGGHVVEELEEERLTAARVGQVVREEVGVPPPIPGQEGSQ